LWCAYAGYVFILVFWLAFWLLAGFIPPPDPTDAPSVIAERFRDNTFGIRLGMVIGIFAAALLLPWGGIVAVQLKRIEGRRAPLAYAWIAASALLLVEFIYPCVWWGVAAYRPTDSPEIIQRFNDMAWLAFVGVASTVVFQALVLALLVLTDEAVEPVYPRWFGYFNIWCGVLITPAGLIFLFHDGPFTWNGLMAFWLVLVAYCLWTVVLSALTVQAIKKQPVVVSDQTAQIEELRAELAHVRAQISSVKR
jgi:hypothetical protein